MSLKSLSLSWGGGNMIDSDDAQSHPIAHPKQVS